VENSTLPIGNKVIYSLTALLRKKVKGKKIAVTLMVLSNQNRSHFNRRDYVTLKPC